MAVLLLGEISQDALNRDATAKAVSAVRNLGEVTVLCVGSSVQSAAKEAVGIEGVAKVLAVEHPRYAGVLAEPVSALLSALAADYEHIAAPATAVAKNVMPRVAALLDVMVMTDVIKVIDADVFERPIYAGNAIQKIRSSDPKKVFTIRVSGFDAAGAGEAAEFSEAAFVETPHLSTWIKDEVVQSPRPELTAARHVVSGGRGLGSKEDFLLIEQLADKLGAAVGASRAAVDSGYAPNDWQIGQTGKIVAPELYVAIGISGAIQHLAGMKDSKIIVAINKDQDAPIFQISDYGLIGDLFAITPEFIKKI